MALLIPQMFFNIFVWVVIIVYGFGLVYFPLKDSKRRKISYLLALVFHISFPFGMGSLLIASFPERKWMICSDCNTKQELKSVCKKCNAKITLSNHP